MNTYRRKKAGLYDSYKYSYVKSYEVVKNMSFEYSLTLDCGHIISRYCRFGKIPEKLICIQCWHETHDKHGNKI